VIALATQYVLTDLRKQSHSTLSDTNYSFDFSGVPTSISKQAVYYQCSVKIFTGLSPFTSIGTNASQSSLTFIWPGHTNSTGNNATVFWTSLAAY